MNVMRQAGVCLMLMIASGPAASQDQRHPTPSAPRPDAPYAGMERRAVKALTDREITDLQAGRGMGLALAAELNGYPDRFTSWSMRRRSS